MTDTTMHVVYSGDEGYQDALQIAVLSLAMSNPSRPLHIYFLSGDFSNRKADFRSLTKETADTLISNCRKYNPDITYQILDMRPIYDKHLRKSLNRNTSYSPYSMLRILLDDVDDLPDKLLYLDGDTIVMKPVDALYDMDLTGHEIAMCQDVVGHIYFGKRYCNSGVALLNMKLIKEEKIFHKTRKFMRTHLLFMPDQTSLNVTCRHRIILPYIYNEQKQTKPETVIRHYCKVFHWLPFPHTVNIKPWRTQEFRERFGDENEAILKAYEAIKGNH